MDKEKLLKKLDRFNKDPKIREALQGASIPGKVEEAVPFFAELAKKNGYDLKEEDFITAIREVAKQRKAHTEEAAAEIERLSDDEVTQAAGGKKDHSICNDTFQDRENCWFNDGCDKNIEFYTNYQCRNNFNGNQCGSNGSSCDSLYICEVSAFGPDSFDSCPGGYQALG